MNEKKRLTIFPSLAREQQQQQQEQQKHLVNK
jgi:hypothetical protein